MSSRLIKADLDNLARYNVSKVVIFECNGKYTVSRATAPGAWEGMDMTRYERRDRTTMQDTGLNQQHLSDLTADVYDRVRQMLEQNGIQVVPMEEVQRNAAYMALEQRMTEVDRDQNKRYGIFDKNITTRTITVPAAGMRMFPTNFFKEVAQMRLMQRRGQILQDTGAQAFVKVEFTVDQSRDFKPILKDFNMDFDTNLKRMNLPGTEVGFTTEAKASIHTTQPIEYTQSVMGSGMGSNMGTGSGTNMGTGTDMGTDMNTGGRSGTGTGTNMNTGTGDETYDSNTGSMGNMGNNTGSSTNMGTNPDAGTGMGGNSGTGAKTGTGTRSGTGTKSGTNMGTGTTTGTGTGTNMGTGMRSGTTSTGTISASMYDKAVLQMVDGLMPIFGYAIQQKMNTNRK
jgi:hypothetical protein